jgi:hypothetical protein
MNLLAFAQGKIKAEVLSTVPENQVYNLETALESYGMDDVLNCLRARIALGNASKDQLKACAKEAHEKGYTQVYQHYPELEEDNAPLLFLSGSSDVKTTSSAVVEAVHDTANASTSTRNATTATPATPATPAQHKRAHDDDDNDNDTTEETSEEALVTQRRKKSKLIK